MPAHIPAADGRIKAECPRRMGWLLDLDVAQCQHNGLAFPMGGAGDWSQPRIVNQCACRRWRLGRVQLRIWVGLRRLTTNIAELHPCNVRPEQKMEVVPAAKPPERTEKAESKYKTVGKGGRTCSMPGETRTLYCSGQDWDKS